MSNDTKARDSFENWALAYLKQQFSFYAEDILREMIVFDRSPVSGLRKAWDARAEHDKAALAEVREAVKMGFFHAATTGAVADANRIADALTTLDKLMGEA